MINSLNNIIGGLEGTSLLSKDDEEASNQMFMGQIPDIWKPWSYPSLKPLGSYVKNLKERIAFFQTWVEEGKPINYWLPGFHFTTGFLTGIK